MSLQVKLLHVTPSKVKSQVVAVRQHSGLSIRQVTDRLGIAKSTVGRIVKAADEDDDINIHRRERCERKRKTTSHDNKMIIRNRFKSPWKTSKELQSDLATAGYLADPSIIRRRLFRQEGLQENPPKSNF